MLSDSSYSDLGLFLFLNTLGSGTYFSDLHKQLIYQYRHHHTLSESELVNKVLHVLAKKMSGFKSSSSYQQFEKESENYFHEKSIFSHKLWFRHYQALSAQERVTLILSLVLKKTDKEVASILAISEGTVRYRVSGSLIKVSRVGS